jgi:hypothetical protein
MLKPLVTFYNFKYFWQIIFKGVKNYLLIILKMY